MKNKELFRLSKLNINSHKNQTRNIKRALIFSIVMIMPVIFLLFAFYGGTIKELNKEKTIISYTIDFDNDNSYFNKNEIHSKYIDRIISFEGLEDYISYSKYYFSYSYFENSSTGKVDLNYTFPLITINNETYILDYYNNQQKECIEFYDLEMSTSIISKAEKEYLKTRNDVTILAGSENIGMNEVVISSDVVDYFNLNYDEVIGKTVSYKIGLTKGSKVKLATGENIANNYLGEGVSIFQDYIIVGVFNAKIYNSLSRSVNGDVESTTSFWLNKKSQLNSSEKINKAMSGSGHGEYIYNESPISLSIEAMSKGLAFIPYGFNYSFFSGENKLLLQFTNFNYAYMSINSLDRYYKLSLKEELANLSFDEVRVGNEILQANIKIYPIIFYFIVIFMIFGIVILFCALINIYNVLTYSMKKRKGFLGMMKALGMNNKDIWKLYFYELVNVFINVICYTIIFSFCLCLLLTIFFNSYLGQVDNHLLIKPRMNLMFYPMTLVIILLLIALVSVMISYVSYISIKRKSITNLLY